VVFPAAAAALPAVAVPGVAAATQRVDAKLAVVAVPAHAAARPDAVAWPDVEAPAWIVLEEELRGVAARRVQHCARAVHCVAAEHLTVRCPWARFHAAVVGRWEWALGPCRVCQAGPIGATVPAAPVVDAAAVLHVRSAG
jgi:hypothetical protein